METKNVLNLKHPARLLLIALFLYPLIFTSCSNGDDQDFEEAYFTIEENPTGLSVDVQGVTQSYVVRSNRPWQVVAQDAAEWVEAFPAEGEDDGIFKFIVDENQSFDMRSINFAFVVDGKEQPVLFRIEQQANVPFITIEDAEDGIAVPSAETEFTISISSNVDWDYSVEDANWLTEVNVDENEITLNASKNRGEVRSAKLIVSSDQYPGLDQEVTITQSPGNIILEENFDWLNYGNAIFYEYKGEVRMDSWTPEEMARGWTSTENVHTSNQRVVYARPGFVKLGKTGYGGDLISPALIALEDETATLKVTFKAVPYQTKGGTQDDNILRVSVVGPGATDINSLTIDNWPDYEADPNSTLAWESEAARYEFVITGATAETQVKFLGGDYNIIGVGKGKNRIFIDDIKVEIIE